MFKGGVKPAWEDPVNSKGSEFRIEVKVFNNNDIVQQLWQKIVFDMVLGNMPHIKDGIAGAKINQRQKQFNFINFRLEIWMTVNDEQSEIIKDIRKYLEDDLIEDCLKDQRHQVNIKFESRKELMKQFEPKN